MQDNHDEAYARFEEDHRTFGAPRRAFSRSLRIRALVVMIAAATVFVSGLFYLAFAAPYPADFRYLAMLIYSDVGSQICFEAAA